MEAKEALGAYEGFSVQDRQALYEIIMCPPNIDATVSIEDIDDVAISHDEKVELIQCKSVLSAGNNPLANRSADLWKTLSRWVKKTLALQRGGKTVEKYRYSVSSERNIQPGEVVTLLHEARGKRESAETIEKIWEMIGKSAASIERYVQVFFDDSNREAAIGVVDAFHLELHADFEAETKRCFTGKGITSTPYIDHLFSMMLGHFSAEKAGMSQNGKSPIFNVREFNTWVASEAQHIRVNPLIGSVKEPEEERVVSVQEERPVFLLLQLHEIDKRRYESEKEDYVAVSSWLRSQSQIVDWTESGLLTGSGLRDYHDELVATWDQVRNGPLSSPADSPDSTIGREIYEATKKEARGCVAEGSRVPLWVSEGQLHELANVDEIESQEPAIVWNPSFIEIARGRMADGQ